MASDYQPLVSVITAVFNDGKTLERAIKSVVNQSYDNIEYIVVDAKSQDRTPEIIKKYSQHIDCLISETDRGTYEGMNKGILKARGEIIYFLNTDDYFFDQNVVRDAVYFFGNNRSADIVYGYIYLNNPENVYKTGKWGGKVNLEILKNGKTICHQAMFTKRKIFSKIGLFDLKYRVAADYDFLCRVYKNGFNVQYFDRIIANFYSLGASAKNNFSDCFRENLPIIREHFGGYNAVVYAVCYKTVQIAAYLLNRLGLLKYFQRLRYRKFFRA